MPPLELNLSLALARLEADVSHGRTFFVHPYEWTLLKAHTLEWLHDLEGRLRADEWRPGAPFVANVPKGGGGVRPAALLPVEDQVVYTAVLGEVISAVKESQAWSERPTDYAYQIRKADKLEWVSVPVWCWGEFRKRSLQAMEQASWAVVTDITACYEHIDHSTLLSDLRAAGVSGSIVTFLSQCLSKWSGLNGRGLPQNIMASHLLAKLYLNRVDQGMSQRGHNHVRYVDDVRIFCNSEAEGKHALLDLAILLRARGLSLQTAKTSILSSEDAIELFEGSLPALRDLLKHYLQDIALQLGLNPDYITAEEAEELIASNKALVPVGLLIEAYNTHILSAPESFDKTLFHFLIRRLTLAGSLHAVKHCLSILDSHPQETGPILSYLGGVNPPDVDSALLDHFTSSSFIYHYQLYQFLRWRIFRPDPPSARLLTFVRAQCTARGVPSYVLSYARAFLGRFGTAADLDSIHRTYGTAATDLERASIICSVDRMEVGLRNAFLGQVRGDGPMCSRAVSAVRSGTAWFAAQ